MVSLLAGLIIVTGMIKIPSFVPGSEFQISAPISVAIVAVFGFWRYIWAGVMASSILFLLGLHTILNVEISMIFRIVVGGIVSVFGTSFPVLIMAGPIGSFVARLGLAKTLDVTPWPLIIAAVPGMVFTMLAVIPLTKVLKKVTKEVGYFDK
ncbi:hypothetical protein [Bacillus solimangrovi]|uniref:hypothetical protein n=1 Tax=Bacillus solimangrovi TaxID=1305675 RepID=UPI001FDF1BF0|nr:hypothetical protein [Bacillus solimangrovi]